MIEKIKIIVLFILMIFLTGCELGNVKPLLDTPNVSIDENGIVTWDDIEGAIEYAYIINNEDVIYTTLKEVQLQDQDYIQIKAIADSTLNRDSKWSQANYYSKPLSMYTVKFYDINGNLLEEVKVQEGNDAVFSKELPVIEDELYEYIFISWNKDLTNIKEDLEVYPIYDEKLIEGKNRIDVPNIIENDNGFISWLGVDNATKYAYRINDGEILYTKDLFIVVEDNDRVKIKAIAEKDYIDSIWSEEIIVDVKVFKEDLNYSSKELADANVYAIDAMPSLGLQKTIVIPVWFNDSSTYIKVSEKEEVRKDIETAFFGTQEETGWNSVKTYYYQDSYGKLRIDGIVTDWYNSGRNAKNITDTSVELIVKDAYNWFKNTYNEDLRKYDTDQNGLIDSICLIYGYPNCESINSTNDNLWAYVYWLQDENQINVYEPGVNTYMFASYDYMYSDAGNNTYCNIDAHTYIHEMGHVLGLEDYYDYSDYTNPTGGFSMQDFNVGGHDPYSKLELGWVEPYIVDDSCTITIKDFNSSGDLILLSPNYTGSVFDEYLLFELYTPDGLNEFDTNHLYMPNWPQGPKDYGIRVWHVDARLLYLLDPNGNFTADKITTEIKDGYYYYQAMSNTYPTKGYDDYASEVDTFKYYNLLYLIRNNSKINYRYNEYLDSNDFFKTGDLFSLDLFKNQFYQVGKLNSGKKLNYQVEFLYVGEDYATIKFTKTT